MLFVGETEEVMSLKEVEVKAKKMALNEVSRRDSAINEAAQFDVVSLFFYYLFFPL